MTSDDKFPVSAKEMLEQVRAGAMGEGEASRHLANIAHGMWSHAEEECDRLRAALGVCERYALRIVGEAKARGGFSSTNAEAIVRVCRENAPPSCAYCSTTKGLRKAGERPADYICEQCFTPQDDGPCFDDLEPAASPPVPADLVAALEEALVAIDEEAPAKEPRDEWTSTDPYDAFLEGRVRGNWDAAVLARRALVILAAYRASHPGLCPRTLERAVKLLGKREDELRQFEASQRQHMKYDEADQTAKIANEVAHLQCAVASLDKEEG